MNITGYVAHLASVALLTAALLNGTPNGFAATAQPRTPAPIGPNITLRIDDDRAGWASGEDMPVLLYSWGEEAPAFPPSTVDSLLLPTPLRYTSNLLSIRKFSDEFTDEFREAFTDQESFSLVTLSIEWPDGGFAEFTLTDVRIVSMRQVGVTVIADRTNDEITFQYGKVEWRTSEDEDDVE